MDRTMELIKKASTGDSDALDTLVRENSPLVWSVVKRFTGRGVDAEDLYQIGAMGLIKAINKFDFSFEVKFSTYAVPMIIGEIRRFLRDDGIIKVSRSLKETAAKIRAVRDKDGENITIEQLSEELNISCEEITLAMEASKEVDSLQKEMFTSDDGGGVTLLERIGDKMCQEEKIVNSLVLNETIAELSEREQKIIKLRYFMDKTQTEAAKEIGISQVQVSRIEKKILEQMRRRML